MALQSERQSGYHQDYVVRDGGDSLVEFPQKVSITTSQRIFGNYAAANLVRHEHDRALCRCNASHSASIWRCDGFIILAFCFEKIRDV